MGFSRQEYWSGLPFPSPGDLPDPGIEPRSHTFRADALTSEPPGKRKYIKYMLNICIYILYIIYICMYIFFWPCQAACRILVLLLAMELMPLHWKHGVLKTGQAGSPKSRDQTLKNLNNLATVPNLVSPDTMLLSNIPVPLIRPCSSK